MIKINLLKNQVPTKVDLPREVRKKKKFVLVSFIAIAAIVLVIPTVYFYNLLKRPKTKLIVSPKKHNNKVIHTKISTNIRKLKLKIQKREKTTTKKSENENNKSCKKGIY